MSFPVNASPRRLPLRRRRPPPGQLPPRPRRPPNPRPWPPGPVAPPLGLVGVSARAAGRVGPGALGLRWICALVLGGRRASGRRRSGPGRGLAQAEAHLQGHVASSTRAQAPAGGWSLGQGGVPVVLREETDPTGPLRHVLPVFRRWSSPPGLHQRPSVHPLWACWPCLVSVPGTPQPNLGGGVAPCGDCEGGSEGGGSSPGAGHAEEVVGA